MAKKKKKNEDIFVDGTKMLKEILNDEKAQVFIKQMVNTVLVTKNQVETLNEENIERLCRMALEEDVGTGDVTTLAIVPEAMQATAFFTTRQDCVCCGLPVMIKLMKMLDKYIDITCHVADGDFCLAGTRLATITGSARAILTGERTALNFMQRLSGVATMTHRYVEALGDSKTKILDTRKTTPGYRELEKYAVFKGGGNNHRIGLYDRFMIKDNHRELAKMNGPDAIISAVEACREYNGQLLVEVEADSPADVIAAVAARADIILLDNMSNKQMAEAINFIEGRCMTEASGGITLERLPSMADLGLDFISVGALTHSAPSIDIGLDM
ncbi:MAG: carboxylating nicotinate-nucleotide diphosphorylase [Victivallales bacterium]|nr:carboxylating nicotinate-nucleotide diphosphorylase [Victivallales bacterium]